MGLAPSPRNCRYLPCILPIEGSGISLSDRAEFGDIYYTFTPEIIPVVLFRISINCLCIKATHAINAVRIIDIMITTHTIGLSIAVNFSQRNGSCMLLIQRIRLNKLLLHYCFYDSLNFPLY